MFEKSAVILSLVAAFTLAAVPAQAQQNWQNNQQNSINQDASLGLINGQQAAQLDGKEAQIRAQEQMWRSAQGGMLTPQQQQQVDSELRGVKRSLLRDRFRDGTAPANAQYGYGQQGFGPNGMMPMQNGMMPMQNGMMPMQNGMMPMQNGMMTPNGMTPQNGMMMNGQQHHHHGGLLNELGGMLNGGQQPGLGQQGFGQQAGYGQQVPFNNGQQMPYGR